MVNRFRIIYITCIFFMLTACKNNTFEEPVLIDPTQIDKSKTYLTNKYENKLKDSVWYYYKTLSLWEEAIPPTNVKEVLNIKENNFIQQNYTQYFEKAEDVLNYLKLLTKYDRPHREQAKDFDWYSLIDRGENISNTIKKTLTSGLGISVFYLQTKSTETDKSLYIQFVENGSPAHEANLQRGDQILSINGDKNINYSFQVSKNFAPLLDYLQSTTLTLNVRKQNGHEKVVTLYPKTYFSKPILTSKTITINDKKIGYFFLKSFASVRSGNFRTSFYYDLETLFSEFENNGINELVIDLRHNGGGDVETAEYLANRLAPSIVDGKIMYTYKVNKFIENLGWLNENEEFAPVKFHKRGSLNLSRVYFLVSSETASASELLINILKPVLDTYLIGTITYKDNKESVADRTYGKPVGFFAYPVLNDNVDLYVSSFKMYNSKGEGDYFNGLQPTVNLWEYNNFLDFGDPEETLLNAALNHIYTGSFEIKNLKASNSLRPSTTVIIEPAVNIISQTTKTGMFKFKMKHLKK